MNSEQTDTYSKIKEFIKLLFFRILSGLTYFPRLFLKPSYKPIEISNVSGENLTIQEKALSIATSCLKSGIEDRILENKETKKVLCAGRRNFREPWARDFGFASFGLLELSEFQVTKECLETFFQNQNPSGQLPVKLHSTNFVDRYLHSLFRKEQPTHLPLRPKYLSAHKTFSLDGNALLIIASLNYIAKTNDTQFFKKHWESLKRALIWMESFAENSDGLISQAKFSDWADSIAREGKVLYTNILYWKVLNEMSNTAKKHHLQKESNHFYSQAKKIKTSINHFFWREEFGYFITSIQFQSLCSDGNLLAIAWGLSTSKQSNSILNSLEKFQMAMTVPTQVANIPYPRKFIALENRLSGISNYHSTASWMWLGAWHIIALLKTKRINDAEILIERLAQKIVQDQTVFEVHNTKGQRLSTFWYQSESPLTWNAGMIVYAFHLFNDISFTKTTTF